LFVPLASELSGVGGLVLGKDVKKDAKKPDPKKDAKGGGGKAVEEEAAEEDVKEEVPKWDCNVATVGIQCSLNDP
jgi:hypothetical protein